MASKIICPTCNGTGTLPYTDDKIICPECNGEGEIEPSQDYIDEANKTK